MKPHALLSNDDGIYAPGLRALAEAFLADGWRVTVCAPDQQRSAASHSITIARPLVVSPAEWALPPSDDLRLYRCDGQPADCVKVALHALTETKPDLVVSGVNNGWNVGMDVHYSGTVGAAAEAAFEYIQALAVSIKNPDAEMYANAAAMAVRVARRMLAHPLPERAIANLNLPDCPAEAVRGLVEAPLTPIRYTDHYECLPNTHGRAAYWLCGDIIEEGRLPGGDLDCLLAGYATLTALGWDLSIPGLLNAHIEGEKDGIQPKK